MRKVITLVLAVSLIPLTVSGAFSFHHEQAVTPYGDFCTQCGKYGTCASLQTDYDAETALKDYYSKKGLGVKIEKKGERFIRARINNKSEVVDIIIFDRKTGRIRSIY